MSNIQHESPHQEIPAEWREFSAGMEFLRRYGTHNTANAAAIGRDNLRLLHRSLLQKADYQQQIRLARTETLRHGRPNKTTLMTSSQLSAQLISLPKKSSLQLIVRPSEHGMFMILSGSANISGHPSLNTRLHWWPRSWSLSQQADVHSHLLKTDDIVCLPHNLSSPCVLTTPNKTCIVLAIFNIRSPSQQPVHATPYAKSYAKRSDEASRLRQHSM